MSEEDEKAVGGGNSGGTYSRNSSEQIRVSRPQIPQGFEIKDLVSLEITWETKLESVDNTGKFIEDKKYAQGTHSGMVVRKDYYDTWIDVLVGEEVLHIVPADFPKGVRLKKTLNP